MSAAHGKRKPHPQSDADGGAGLDPELVARIRADIVGGPGVHGSDPVPRARKTPSRRRGALQEGPVSSSPHALQPMESMYLKIAKEKVTIRQGDSATQVTLGEAVTRSQFKSAIGGNARAQADVTREIAKATAREAAILDADNQFWRSFRDLWRAEIAEAKRLGQPEPHILPHPEDIVIKEGEPVRFIGPVDEAGLKRFESTRRMRDQMVLWKELDERERGLLAKKGTEERMSAAALYLHVFQSSLPPRMRLGEDELFLRMEKARKMTKRTLLKTLHAGWRALGRPAKRGILPPTLAVAKQQIQSGWKFIAALQSGELDVEKLSNGIMDEDARDVLERIGVLKGKA